MLTFFLDFGIWDQQHSIHTTAHYVNMYGVETTQVRPNTAVGIMYTQPGGFTGHLMLLIMVLMYTTAVSEAFWEN